ncbi:MAG: hypothetical protein ACXWT0_01830 [Methylobacter sp.]
MAYKYIEYVDENGDLIESMVEVEDEEMKDVVNMVDTDKDKVDTTETAVSTVVKKSWDTANVQNYRNIAEAIRKSGDNRSNLVGIMAEYQALTGSEINKSTLRRKLCLLDGVLAKFK